MHSPSSPSFTWQVKVFTWQYCSDSVFFSGFFFFNLLLPPDSSAPFPSLFLFVFIYLRSSYLLFPDNIKTLMIIFMFFLSIYSLSQWGLFLQFPAYHSSHKSKVRGNKSYLLYEKLYLFNVILYIQTIFPPSFLLAGCNNTDSPTLTKRHWVENLFFSFFSGQIWVKLIGQALQNTQCTCSIRAVGLDISHFNQIHTTKLLSIKIFKHSVSKQLVLVIFRRNLWHDLFGYHSTEWQKSALIPKAENSM